MHNTYGKAGPSRLCRPAEQYSILRVYKKNLNNLKVKILGFFIKRKTLKIHILDSQSQQKIVAFQSKYGSCVYSYGRPINSLHMAIK